MGARRLAGLTAAALLLVPVAALAAPAAPDPGFGTAGVVVTDVAGKPPLAAGMLLDRSGRAVVVAKTGATELGFMRRLPNGAADVAATRPLGAGVDSQLTEVAEQPDGGYLAGGWINPTASERRFALVRYTAAGAPDAAFGVRSESPGTGNDEIRALAVQPDGRIVAAGRAGSAIGFVRYSPAGTAELTRTHDFAGVTGEVADGVVVDPGGRILLAGTGVVSGERRFLLAALTPGGEIDGGFGTNGIATLDVGDGEAAVRSVERQPDGKLVVAGTSDAAGNGSGVVTRFLPDGTPDPAFSTDGIARLGVTGAIVEDVALQPDGKIVAVGSVAGDSVFARFRPGGARDPGFGTDGVARRSFTTGDDRLTGVGVASNGGIVAGGLEQGRSIVLAKLTGGDSSDPALAMGADALGDLVTFTVTATNPGADPAQDVRVAVIPPGGAAATALATAGGACDAGSCGLGTLPAGATRRITLLARAKAPGALTARAQITGATFDSEPGNNSASATGVATANRVVRRDRTRPRLALRLPARRIGQVRRGVELVVRTSEAANVVVRTRAKLRGRVRTFAQTKTVTLRRKGSKRVRLALTDAGKRAVRRKKTRRIELTVRARARDRAGNKRTKTLHKTLRRA